MNHSHSGNDPKMVLVSKIDIRMSSLHIQTNLIPEMEILTTYSQLEHLEI